MKSLIEMLGNASTFLAKGIPGSVVKQIVGPFAAGLTLAISGCFLFGSHPRTWEGRYQKAVEEYHAAPYDLHRFYALSDAAKASFEVGETRQAQAYAQQAHIPTRGQSTGLRSPEWIRRP